MVNKAGAPVTRERSRRLWRQDEPLLVEELRHLCGQSVDASLYPLADRIERNVPVYRLPAYETTTAEWRADLQDEWYHILLSGPGVYVLENFYTDSALIDDVNGTFEQIIREERAAGSGRGDHFSAAGGNQRIWNSFSKHAEHDAESFTQYYSNPWLALVCESWLGPAYRITAQVNIVNPGGAPQVSHRDYHLGFQTESACGRFPKAMQIASQLLTLQGAVAHTEMPLESGPTRLLPFSQLYEPGYMAYRRPEFVEYFNQNWVSSGLHKGDGIFFNPALFHAAGENKTQSVSRSANLLQVSSAFGKPMETIETLPIIEQCWDALVAMHERGHTAGEKAEVTALINAIADGYPFPTNLDRRTPRAGGLAPETEQELLHRSLKARTTKESLLQILRGMRSDSLAA